MLVVLPATVIVTTLLSLAATWRGGIDYLPTLGWLMLMLLPYCIEYPLFDPVTRDLQGSIITGIAALFCALDAGSARVREAMAGRGERTKPERRVAVALFATFAILAVLHLSKAPSIPLLDVLKSDLDPGSLLELRNGFSRYLEVSPVEKYLFNSAPFVLGAPAAIMLIGSGTLLPAVCAALLIGVYTVLSSAKVPLTLFGAMLLLGSVLRLAPRMRRLAIRLAMVGGVVLLTGLAILSGSFQSDGLLSGIREKLTRPQAALHLGDYVRAREPHKEEAQLPLAHAADYLLYRVIFTPVEVSSRWYEYFNRYPAKEARIERFITDSKSGERMHPAQLIGIEQYHSRFPGKYPVETYAYASFDADAYARWGLRGVVITLLLYAGMRLSIAAVDPEHSAAGGALYVPGVVLLSALPATASLQAIIAAHGFPLLIVLGLVINWRTIGRVWQARHPAMGC